MALELVAEPSATPQDRLAQAEAEVRSYCEWHIAPSRTETVVVDGNGGASLLLPSLHVTAVASVVDEDGNAVSDWTWRPNGVLRRRGGWGCDVAYTVTLSHGYDEVPADVTGVVQALAASDQSLGPMKSQTMGPFGATFGAPEHATKLDRYKLPKRP